MTKALQKKPQRTNFKITLVIADKVRQKTLKKLSHKTGTMLSSSTTSSARLSPDMNSEPTDMTAADRELTANHSKVSKHQQL